MTDDATIHIQSIIPAAVDIAATSGAGFNDGGAVNREPAAVAALGVNVVAGDETFVASLFLANEGAATESYLFSAWSDMAATTPMGGLWRIEFSDNGARNLSHSAPLPGAGADQFELYVTAPINLAPGVYPLYVKVVGGASGATDILRIDVTVTAAQAALSLTPDGEGVVAPCSSVFYDHVLRNGGAAAINAELAILGQTTLGGSLLLPSSSAGGEPSAFTTDINFPVGAQVAVNSGGVWGTAAMVAPFGAAAAAIPLAPGDWTVVRVRVSAACDVPARALDVLTLKATASNGDSRRPRTPPRSPQANWCCARPARGISAAPPPMAAAWPGLRPSRRAASARRPGIASSGACVRRILALSRFAMSRSPTARRSSPDCAGLRSFRRNRRALPRAALSRTATSPARLGLRRI